MTKPRSHSRTGRGRSGLAAVLTVTALVGGSFIASTSAQAATKTAAPTMVVKAVNNSMFGMILETKKKMLPLYTFDKGTCTPANSCSLAIWPALLMPKGKTVPGGVPTGLGTQPFGKGMLQVTYKGSPLYTFYMDKKNMVNGNGLGGFTVAHV